MKINMKNNSKCIKTHSRVMEDLNNPINIEHGSRVGKQTKFFQKTNHRKHQVKEDSQQNSTKSPK